MIGKCIRFLLPAMCFSLLAGCQNASSSREEDMAEAIQPVAELAMTLSDRSFYPEPQDNETARAFLALLETDPLQLDFTPDESGFSTLLEAELPADFQEMDAEAGDILLREDGMLVICTRACSGRFVRIARTYRPQELAECLEHPVTGVAFWLQWSE